MEEEEEEEDEGENTENILPSSQRIEVINNSKAKKKQVKENDGDDPLFKLEGTIVNTCPSSYKNISNSKMDNSYKPRLECHGYNHKSNPSYELKLVL